MSGEQKGVRPPDRTLVMPAAVVVVPQAVAVSEDQDREAADAECLQLGEDEDGVGGVRSVGFVS